MAKELTFYGASDDLLECEGAIREEGYWHSFKPSDLEHM